MYAGFVFPTRDAIHPEEPSLSSLPSRSQVSATPLPSGQGLANQSATAVPSLSIMDGKTQFEYLKSAFPRVILRDIEVKHEPAKLSQKLGRKDFHFLRATDNCSSVSVTWRGSNPFLNENDKFFKASRTPATFIIYIDCAPA